MADNGGRGVRLQGPLLAALLLTTVISGGTLGYIVIEGWSVWDAFYMTIITITTVGYREVHELSFGGEVFTVVLSMSGVGAALYTFTLVASIVVEGGLPRRLQWRRRAAMLERISNHFIVCGYGRIGETVVRQFQREGVPCVVIERKRERFQAALENGLIAVEADASAEDALKRAAIHRARGLIAAVGSDAENVYTALSAHVLRPELPIVARAETEDAVTKLRRAGATRVISPYQIGAMQMAHTALRPAVVDFFELATSSEHLELAIEEIPVTSTSPLAGRSVLEANLRQRYGIIVVGIQRLEAAMEFNPEPSTSIIGPGDKLVVLGRPESLKRLEVEALS